MSEGPLITAEAMAERMGDPSLRILDASWHLDGRDARVDFEAGHIPGAQFFDLDAVSEADTDLPHMLPTPSAFAAAMGALGVSADDSIVVYDSAGLFSAARAWWMLQVMGAKDVKVMEGGLPRWRAEARQIERGAPTPAEPVVFSPAPSPEQVAALDDVRAALAEGEQVIDARGAPRFRGAAPEPRPGLRGGHMPGAVNLPFPALLEPGGMMKRGAALMTVFTDAGVDLNRPIITSCGSGVTAAILSLALAELGRSSRLYDGSWAEWGGREDTAVVTGP